MEAKKRQKTKRKIKILVADHEGIFRLGLRKLFSLEDDLRVVAQAESAPQVLAMLESFRPDLVMIQQQIADGEDCNLFAEVRHMSPSCKIIAVVSAPSEEIEKRIMASGASGMLSKSDRPEAFVKSVRKVMKGETVVPQSRPPSTDGGIIGERRPRPVDTLTRREKAIVSCLTQGWRNREIAQHLTITEQTVKNHLRSIYDKVGVSDRLELVLYAIHQRLELPPINP
jgi:DNA-binding NarL/FixJ family response regulator